MSAPLVSVILSFFNNAATLAAAIRSILRQTVPDFELLLIDAGSEDGSFEVARCFRDPRIRLFRIERNRGQVFCHSIVGRQRNQSLLENCLRGIDRVARRILGRKGYE